MSRPTGSPSGSASTEAAARSLAETVDYVARGLVDSQDAVEVTYHTRGSVIELHLSVDPDEMGKVIGRQGRVVKALRSVLIAAATRAGKRVVLEVG